MGTSTIGPRDPERQPHFVVVTSGDHTIRAGTNSQLPTPDFQFQSLNPRDPVHQQEPVWELGVGSAKRVGSYRRLHHAVASGRLRLVEATIGSGEHFLEAEVKAESGGACGQRDASGPRELDRLDRPPDPIGKPLGIFE